MENDDFWYDELEEARVHDACVVDAFWGAGTDIEDGQCNVSEAAHSEPEQLDEGDEGNEADDDVAPEPADHGGTLPSSTRR